MDAVFPFAHFPDRSVTEDGESIVVETATVDGVFFAQRAGWLNIGDIILYRHLESKLYISPLAACYVLSFSLGMRCRYFPTTWISIGRTEKGDAFYPLATRLLDWIEEIFPAVVVDVLRGLYDFETR